MTHNEKAQLDNLFEGLATAIRKDLLDNLLGANRLEVENKSTLALAFKVIDNEWNILEEHEDKEIYANRHKHFIDYHDHVLNQVRSTSPFEFYKIIQGNYGQDYIMNVFAKDSRSLSELMAEVGNKYREAVDKLEETKEANHEEVVFADENNELHNKLKNLLAQVKDVLEELSEGSEATHKHYEIESELASFKIDLFKDLKTQAFYKTVVEPMGK